MRRLHFVLLSVPLVALWSSLASGADDPPPFKVLEEKGLTRVGRYLVIEAETPVLDKWKSTRTLLADHARASEQARQAALAAQQVAQLDRGRSQLEQTLNDLNQEIHAQVMLSANNRMGGPAQGVYLSRLMSQRDMIHMSLAQIEATQQYFDPDATPGQHGLAVDNQQTPQAQRQKSLELETQRSLEAARSSLKQLRELVDAAAKRYEKLDADASVKAAFRALEKQKLGIFKLGPSPAFKAAVKALENAERTVLDKKATSVPRKRAGARK
jgi:hypothetical protein